MKVFLPISDAMLGERAELSGVLIPFTHDLLHGAKKTPQSIRPVNWISDASYDHARQRLSQSAIEPTLPTLPT